MERFLSRAEAETERIASELAAQLTSGDLVFIYGELGAGKTTFVRGFTAYFSKGMEVSSPTFTLINVYPTQPLLVHCDLYRISDDSDLYDLGIDEYLDNGAIVLVEWAEKAQLFLPRCRVQVRLKFLSESDRELLIEEVNDDSLSN